MSSAPTIRPFFLRLLISRFHENKQAELFRFLPENTVKELHKVSIPFQKGKEVLHSFVYGASEVLPLVHYSWYCKYLKEHASATRKIWIACLPDNLRDSVAQYFDFPKELKKPLGPVRRRLKRFLFDVLKPPQIPLPGLIPETAMKVLFDLKKKEIVALVDLLGVLEIRETLRRMVDKTTIQEIFHAMTPLQQKYLKKVFRNRDRGATREFPWKECRGDAKKLQRILHTRGLFRLGRALKGEEEGFLWYFLHRLDTGRAELIEKSWEEKTQDPNKDAFFRKDVFDIVGFLSEVESN